MRRKIFFCLAVFVMVFVMVFVGTGSVWAADTPSTASIGITSGLSLYWDHNPSAFFTYKFGFYPTDDQNMASPLSQTYALTANRTSSSEVIANSEISASGEVLIKWEVSSPETNLALYLEAYDSLYGSAATAEVIPALTTVTANSYSGGPTWENSAFTFTKTASDAAEGTAADRITWGATENDTLTVANRRSYNKQFATLTPGVAGEGETTPSYHSAGSALVKIQTGNAFGKAIQAYQMRLILTVETTE